MIGNPITRLSKISLILFAKTQCESDKKKELQDVFEQEARRTQQACSMYNIREREYTFFVSDQAGHNDLKLEKNSNFKCVFGWLHDYLKD